MTTPTTLYRLYGHDGALLYIGVASNPGRRFSQHNAEKPWWGEVAGCTFEHHAEREDALNAEVAAILAERPRYNVRHGTAPRARRAPSQKRPPRPTPRIAESTWSDIDLEAPIYLDDDDIDLDGPILLEDDDL